MAATSDHHAALAAWPVRLGPRAIGIACIVALAALGWIYVGVMVAAAMRAGAWLGPGMGLLDTVLAGRFDTLGSALLDALCRPGFRQAASSGTLASSSAEFVLTFLMWAAMVLAMMLPTAAPMVLAYGELAETAAAARERAVSPLVLAAGYLTVWMGFAVVAALLQRSLTALAILDPALVAASALFSGAVFVGAGAYQFSPLKQACVTVCRQPFPYLLAHWSTEPGRIFRLGVSQGLHCVGCCWALMLVMLAVGVMNVVWMAGLGLVMAAEKLAGTARFSRAVGIVLVAIGAATVAVSIVQRM
jgi:predicted metal-binding membrane protein